MPVQLKMEIDRLSETVLCLQNTSEDFGPSSLIASINVIFRRVRKIAKSDY